MLLTCGSRRASGVLVCPSRALRRRGPRAAGKAAAISQYSEPACLGSSPA